MNFAKVKEELLSDEFAFIGSKSDNYTFQRGGYRLRFVDQRFDGWECYLYYGDQFEKFVRIGFITFLFSEKIKLEDILFHDGGLLSLMNTERIKEFISYYKLNLDRIYRSILEARNINIIK